MLGAVGVYAELEDYKKVIDGTNGTIVPTEAEAWANAILNYLRNEDIRVDSLKQARDDICNNKLLKYHYEEIAQIFGYKEAISISE